MAFAPKWTVEKKNKQTENIWRAHIEEDGATFDSDLSPARVPFACDWQPNTNDPDWLFAPSVGSVEFIDDETGLLNSIFSGGTDERYRIRLTEEISMVEIDRWVGYVLPESYKYNFLGSGVSQLQASDRLKILKERAYEVSPGVPYTGQAKFSTIIARCLAQTNLGIGVATHSTRYSWLDANPLDGEFGTSDDPLGFHSVDQLVYLDSAGDPLSCWDVLTDICLGWGLQIFQGSINNEIRWCVFERKRNVNAVLPWRYDAHLYEEDGTYEGLSYGEAQIFVSSSESVALKFARPAQVAAEIPIGSAAFIFNHGSLGNMWENLGFDDTTLSDAWTVTGSMGTSLVRHQGNKSLDVPVGFDTDEDAIPTAKIVQSAKTDIAAATGYRFRVSLYADVPNIHALPTTDGFLYGYWSFKIGTDYWNQAAVDWDPIGAQTDEDILNQLALHDYLSTGGFAIVLSFVTDVLDGLSGTPVFELRAVTEHDNGTDPQSQLECRFDTLELTLLDNNDLEIKQARQTTSSLVGTSNQMAPTIQCQFGEGPLTAFPGALIQYNNLGTEIGLAENWTIGVPGTEPTPAVSFDQLHNVQRLKQYSEPTRTIAGTIISSALSAAGELDVTNTIRVERPESTTFDNYMWYKGFTWRPANPYQLVTASWAAINDVTLPSTNHAVTSLEEIPNSTGTGGVRSFTSVITLAGTGTLDVVESHPNLESITVGDSSAATVMKSYTASKDKGAGVFIQDHADTSTPLDDVTVFASTDGRRIKRVDRESPWKPQWAGAQGDGTTSDDSFLQKLFDAAGAEGRACNIPPGRYVINNTIVIDGYALTIEGQNPSMWLDDGRTGFPSTPQGAVFISGASLTGPMITIEDTVTDGENFAPVRISNLRMIGNKDGAGTDTHAIQVIGVSGVRVDGCVISNFSSRGISVEQSGVGNLQKPADFRAVGNTIAFCGGHGIRVTCESSVFDNNLIYSNDGGGFLADENSFGNSITGNGIILNTGSGLECLGVGLDVIEGNRVTNNTGRGILVAPVSGNVLDTVVNANICWGNGTDDGLGNDERSGIVVAGLRHGAITGNVCSFNEAYGLFFGLENFNLRISGNVGGNNTISFSNTRNQSLGPFGAYSLLDFGILQRDNEAGLLIQALIDFVPEGSTLIVPPGDYLVSTTINVNKSLRIIGTNCPAPSANVGSYFKAGSTLNGPMLSLNTAGVVVEGLSFLGNASAPSTAAIGLNVGAACIDSKVKDCAFNAFKGHGADVAASAMNIEFNSCSFQNNGLSGLRIQGIDCVATLCRAIGNATAGINVFGAVRTLITNCPQITGSGTHGIQASGGTDALVQSNHIYANGGAGIAFLGASERHSAISNKIDGNGTDTGLANVQRAGVYLGEGQNHAVKSNDIGDKDGTPTQLYAITTDSLLVSASILDNFGVGNATGFYLLDSTNADALDIDLEHTENINIPSLTAGSTHDESITITGARGGDRVMLGPPTGLDMDIDYKGKVSADDTLILRFRNEGSGTIDEAAADWKITLRRRAGATASSPPASSLVWAVQIQFTNNNLLFDA